MWFSNQSSTRRWTSSSRSVYSWRPRRERGGRGEGAKLKWISLQEDVYLEPILVVGGVISRMMNGCC